MKGTSSEHILKEPGYCLVEHWDNCLLCGKPLVYSQTAESRSCVICHENFLSSVVCEQGHYVCDSCHSTKALSFLVPFLISSDEKSPHRLFESVISFPQIHMHGPEHHFIVPCVLLTCYVNCGGKLDIEESILEAIRRGKQVLGGSCGYWGACGASVGAGIFASIVTGSSPLNDSAWSLPQKLVSDCLSQNAEIGGVRCCKRTSRTAISAAVLFARDVLGVSMPDDPVACAHSARNEQCLADACPYYKEHA